MFNKGNMAQLLQQAKKMQDELMKKQSQLENIDVIGEAGAGLVKVTISCKYKIKEVIIDPSLFSEGDIDTLQDLITGAFNNAFKQIEEKMQDNMGDLKGMMPNNMPFPF